MSWEEAHTRRKDYEMSVLLQGKSEHIAVVKEWLSCGTLVLEYLQPVDSSTPLALPQFLKMAVCKFDVSH